MDEMRKQYADLAARSKFTKSGDNVKESRTLFEESLPREVTDEELELRSLESSSQFTTMIADELIEVG